MLRATVQQLEDATVLCCRGQIVAGDACAILRETAMGHRHASLLILDLAEAESIDAAGLGVLLDLRKWAQANGIRFKLMNVRNRVEEVLELTGLDRVFEFCSVRESLSLLHRATVACRNHADEIQFALHSVILSKHERQRSECAVEESRG